MEENIFAPSDEARESSDTELKNFAQILVPRVAILGHCVSICKCQFAMSAENVPLLVHG